MRAFVGWCLAAAWLLAPSPSAAQAARLPLPFGSSPLRASSFGGTGLLLATRVSSAPGPLRLGGEAEVGWGAAEALGGGGIIGIELPRSLLLTAAWNGASASRWGERQREGGVTLGLEGRRGGLLASQRYAHGATDGFTTELGGKDLRAWIGAGTRFDLGVGLTVRASEVLDRGGVDWERRYVVAGYQFVSSRRFEYLEAAAHRDVEVDVSADVSRFRVSLLAGHGVSSGAAPDRRWAYARVVTPIRHGLEAMLEGGRNAGLPALGRTPQGFLRVGLRLDLTHGDDADGPAEGSPRPPRAEEAAWAPLAGVETAPAGPRLVVSAPGATTVEVRGDFTAWEAVAMERAGPSWVLPVPSGVLRFNLRVDGGAWGVPTGLPLVPDEFSGAPVALIVVTSP